MSDIDLATPTDTWVVTPYNPATDEAPPGRHMDDCTGEPDGDDNG